MSLLRRFFSTKIPSPTEQLESLYKLSTAVNSIPSTTEKHSVLLKHPACHSVLKRIYDPHLRHHVTSKTVKKYIETHPSTCDNPPFRNLNDLLDALSSRSITGNAANEAVASFYKTFCKTSPIQDTFWKVLDRNLKMGVSVLTVRHLLTSNNETTEKHNRLFRVALANSKSTNFDLSKGSWYASQKLDGIRCIAFIKQDDIQFYSRTGRPFTSLQRVRSDVEKRLRGLGWHKDFALDGEVCTYTDDNGKNENFLAALSQIRRMNEEMQNPVFQAFDLIPLDQFLAAKGDQKFSERQENLKTFIGSDPLPCLKMVEQQKLTSYEQLENMKVKAIQSGWEGLILRNDIPYEGKRTKNMLKVKEWEDAEYIVKSIETGLMRMPTGELKRVMTNVNIEHKGNPVGVGSGFSLNSRITYAEDPRLIIGKPITVRYFSESKKDDGTTSLRFPTVKAVYEEGKRNV